MSKPRNFLPNRYYHLINRIAHRVLYFDAEERSRFVDRMWRVAVFSGVEVLAYCVMSNHFHILAYVPEAVELTDDELKDRIMALYALEHRAEAMEEWDRASASPAGMEELRAKYIRRMYDASEFMKTLLQHTSISFNSRNRHAGTMWEGPFRARMFDPEEKGGLAAVAAYIDRNPVKAGLVTWPDAYEWCSFSAADKGDKRCIDGYARIYSHCDPCDWKAIREAHGKVIAHKLWELTGDESSARSAELEAFVIGEKRGKILPRCLEDAAESQRRIRLVERGSNKVAFRLLELLRESFLGPAELRQKLGISSAYFFSSRYLTPMEASGLIEPADGCSSFSPNKKFRLTAKGAEVLATP